MSREIVDQMELLIRRDPAQRGLISSEEKWGPLCPGHLFAAASHMAEHAKCVAIVTGFFIPKGTPPAAETDGPLGAMLLAHSLATAGIRTVVITDSLCGSAVRAMATAYHYPTTDVLECQLSLEKWCLQFWMTSLGKQVTHLISLERVGPSHTLDSMRMQPRLQDVPEALYEQLVPEKTRGHCHNMRGDIIDSQTAPLHRLFEIAKETRPDVMQIGIGDGGNEIGMGMIPWEELARRLSGELSPRIPCRIATDWNIIAGTSNWGGYALAAATLAMRGASQSLSQYTREQQEAALIYSVEHGPSVDGVTRQLEPTVDGLPFDTYIKPWIGIRELLGLS